MRYGNFKCVQINMKHLLYQSVKWFGSRSGPTLCRQKFAFAWKAKVPLI